MFTKRTLPSLVALFVLLSGDISAQTTYTENSTAQFNAGSYSGTCLSGTGDSVRIILDHYGRSAGLDAPDSERWFDPSWKYRRALTVSSGVASPLADYRVPLTIDTQALIAAGRMNADGADLRFTTSTAAGGAQPLAYSIESGLNTGATKVWVKVPSLPAGGSALLYQYYGNPAAPSESSMTRAFVMGDEFSGPDGTSPSTATWNSIQSGSPAAGSAKDIQGNRLRLRFGSSSGLRYYGLRSAGQYSFSGGRRYHAVIEATAAGPNASSFFTLCPTMYSYSDHEDDWIRFSLTHSAVPAFKVESNAGGTRSVLAGPANTAVGLHEVEFLIYGTAIAVLLDGVEVYRGDNNLNFTNPYVYLESASSYSSLNDFLYDSVFVTPYASPEPSLSSTGAEQGRYFSSGSFLSQVRDTGARDTRLQNMDWNLDVPTSTALSVEARSHNSDISMSAFVPAARNADPGLTGRYVQYRLVLGNTDVRQSPSLSTMTLTYTSPPKAPLAVSGNAVSDNSITWSWQDAASGQYEEDGVRVYGLPSVLQGAVGTGTTFWTENGFLANAPVTRYAQSFNVAGASSSANATCYTLPAQPNVSCDRAAGSWNARSATFTFTNQAGFGMSGVAYYRYAWDPAATRAAWTDTEPPWNAGPLLRSPAASGSYYLHVKSFNGDNVAGGTADYGPFRSDSDLPQVTGFTPSSSAWTNGGVSCQVSFTDAGGSTLLQAHYRWTTSTDRPSLGWSAWDSSFSGAASGSITAELASAGQWYLHAEVQDGAGNTAYSYAGPYCIDLTPPSGTISIENGNAYTPSRDVTLSLSCFDADAGVQQVRYRNQGEAWTAWEAPNASRAWTLTEGIGAKTAEYEIRDAAGNVTGISDSITYDDRTAVSADALAGVRVSGAGAGETETLTVRAALRYLPNNAPLADKTVQFLFQGSPQTVVTDAVGVATAAYTVPPVSGTYTYSATFPGDGVYAADSDTAPVAAVSRTTLLTAGDVTTTANSTFTVVARLKDWATTNDIAGRSISFAFLGSTKTVLTDALGCATTTYYASSSTDVYTCTADFYDDGTYASRSASARVAIGLELTTLSAFGASGIARSTVTVQASLSDGTNPVADKEITFVFLGSTRTALTGADGIAVSSFTVPNSSGTYAYTASFAGDANYYASNTSGNIAVSVRPVTLVPDNDPRGYALGAFDTWAKLADGATGDGIAGKQIHFLFEGSTRSVATDAAGFSTATFASGALARATSCYYFFAGDGDYGFCEATAPATIERRTTLMTAYDAASLALSTITARIELRDTVAGAGLAGREVSFIFLGQVKTAFTDGVGIASVTYASNISTGAYTFSATFARDGAYEGASSTGNVTVDLRATSLAAFPRWVNTLDPIQTVAELKDTASNAFIAHATVTFAFNGTNVSTTTDAAGRAYAVFAGTPVAGSYGYGAFFAGDAAYAASSDTTKKVTAQRRLTSLSASPVAAAGNDDFSVTATLLDGAVPLAGKTVTFLYQGAPKAALTDALGTATTTYTAPPSSGTAAYSATFAQDATYEGSSSTAAVTVSRRPVTLIIQPAVVPTLNSVFLNAVLADRGSSAGLSGMPVQFLFQGTTITANTAGDGSVTAGPFAAIASSGAYPCSAGFDGTALYASITATETVTVQLRDITLVQHDVAAIANSSFTVRADLIDSILSSGIGSKTISFFFNGSTRTATTNAGGIAVSSYTAPASTGAYTYTASFNGQATYESGTVTGNVTVDRRPTALIASDVSAPASSTFTVTATLRDAPAGTTLPGKDVTFTFLGTSKTVTTDGSGVASTTFVAPPSSGTYTFSAAFAGDAVYEQTGVTRNVYASRRTVLLQVLDMPAVALSSFTVRAILKDAVFNTAIPGKTVSFVFQGTTGTATTDASGVALSSYTAPSSTGTLTYTGSFAGDALYLPGNGSALVTIGRRTVTIDAQDVTQVPACSTFTVTAVMTDVETGAAISTRTLCFLFQAVSKNADTSAVGVATTSFVAPSSIGAFTYTASFDGDALYGPAAGTGQVTVITRTTVLQANDAPAVLQSTFSITAVLRDYASGTGLSGRDVDFVFQGSTFTARTDAGGLAVSTFTAPSLTGTYTYTVRFNGDSLYASCTSQALVTVDRRPVSLNAQDLTQIPASSTFTVTAVLRDALTGMTVSTRTLTFLFQGVSKNADTSAVGVATASYVAPSSTGTFTYTASFAGDAFYAPASDDGQVSVITRTTMLQANDASAVLQSTFSITAVLKDFAHNTALIGKQVSFVFQGSTFTAVTGAGGVAVSTYTAPSSTGTYAYTVRFNGDSLYEACTGQALVAVGRRPVSLNALDLSSINAQSTFTVTALMTDMNTGAAIPAMTLSFYFQGSTRTAATDGVGIATTTYVSPASTGTATYIASFDGDALYAPASDIALVSVGQRPTVIEVVNVADARVGLPFTGQARLKDFETQVEIATQTITFVFSTATAGGMTNAVGVATAAFTAPVSSGTYPYSASFAGNGLYGASQSTGSVTVNLRPADFTLTDISVLALDTFTVRGTLTDGITGTLLSDRTVSFVFAGTTHTALTDAFGVATSTFAGVVSSGTYTYTGYSYVDSMYAADTSQALLTVNRRPVVFVPGVGYYLDWIWTLTTPHPVVQLIDGNTSTAIPGKQISFVLLGSTKTAATDGNGWATGNYTLTISTDGWYPCDVSFDGDATYLAARHAYDTNNGVYVAPRNTSLTVYPVDTTINTQFQARAKLMDVDPGNAPIPGKTVKFTFQGSTQTAVTDGSGVAVSTFTSPGVTGIYQLRADFVYDRVYQAASSTDAVRVNIGETMLQALPETLFPYPGTTFTAQTKLIAMSSGLGVPGRPIAFVFQGATVTVNTNGSGIAAVNFTAPPAIDTFTFTAAFEGDTGFYASNTTGTVVVVRGPTVVAGTPVVIPAGDTFGASATLKLTDETKIPDKTIIFVFQSTSTFTKTAVTDSQGVATVSFEAPLSTGSYNFTAAFWGDDLYDASTDTVNSVTVTRRAATLSGQAVTAYVGDDFGAHAFLVDSGSGTALGGRTITFALHQPPLPDQTAAEATEYALGEATASFTAITATGTYNCSATFAGDSLYAMASDTKTVAIIRRVTDIDADSVLTSPSTDFIVTAYVNDVTPTLGGQQPIAGITVQFLFGPATAYAVTDAVGKATATFVSPPTASTYSYTASFAGDARYGPGSASNIVTVQKRQTTIAGEDVATAVGSEFWAKATLLYSSDGTPLANHAIRFVFQSTYTVTRTSTTNASGAAQVPYVAPLSTGTYAYRAYFDGDPTCEASTSAVCSVTVNVGSTTLNVPDVTTVASGVIPAVFVATASLVNTVTGSPIPGKNVRFLFGGDTFTAATDGFGVAQATYTAPSSSGTYRIDACFDGDVTYEPSQSSGTVTVLVRPVMMLSSSVVVIAEEVFTATTTLKDQLGSAALPDKPVRFVFEGQAFAVVTDAYGVAYATYAAPSSSGTYRVDTYFDGDTAYDIGSATAAVTVLRRDTILSVDSGTAIAMEVFTATAALKDVLNGSRILNGKPVQFVFQGSTFASTTDGFGVAYATYTAPTSSGTYRIEIYFSGDATYNPSSSTNTITVTRRPSTAAMADITGTALDVFTTTATLADAMDTGKKLNGRQVRFVFQGSTHTMTADALGVAVSTFTAPASSGTYRIDAYFDGDATYDICTVSATVTIIRRNSVIDAQNVSGIIDEIFTSTATLKYEKDQSAVNGRPVRFVFQESTFTATSQGSGIAVSTFTAPSSSGTYRIDAYFDGDATYNPSQSSATVTVARRPIIMASNNVTTIAEEVFTGTTTVTNKLAPYAAVGGRTVNFVFNSSTFTAATNGSGVAISTYTAPSSSGTYRIETYFAGDARYEMGCTSATVTVARRGSYLAVDSGTAIAMEVFTATAALKDVLNASKMLTGKTVRFVFQNSTYTATTDSFGVAYATYTAPTSSGSYKIEIYFSGDATYNPSSSTSTVTVTRRPSKAVMADVTGTALDIFTTTATLADVMDSSKKLNGRKVRFVFQGSTHTMTADALGVAVSTFTAPASSGTYRIDAYFDGDATYDICTVSATVTIIRRNSVIDAQNVSSIIDEIFTSSATLRYAQDQSAVNGRPVRFVFQESTFTATSQGSGIAVSTFTAPSSSGTYRIDAYFDGDATYNPSQSSATVTIIRRPIVMASNNVTTIAEEVFTGTTTVTNKLAPYAAVGGRTVNFVFNNSTFTVLTNGSGVAVSTYTAPSSSGTYRIETYFAGDARYEMGSTSATVTVSRRGSYLAVDSGTATAMEVFTATAALKDVTNASKILTGKTVRFVFQNSTYTATTDSFGVAYATYTAPTSSGSYKIEIYFSGDATYNPSSSTNTITVTRRPSAAAMSDITGTALDIFTTTATLADAMDTGKKLNGRKVRFVFQGSTHTMTADALGVAVSTFTAPASSGTYRIDAYFDGDATYGSSQSSATVTILRRDSVLAVDNSTAYALDAFSSSATLRYAKDLSAVSGKTVRFVFQGSTFTATTQGSGIAVSTFTAPSSSGTYRIDAYFDGDATYNPGQSSATVTIIRRPIIMASNNVTTIAEEVFTGTTTVTNMLAPHLAVGGRTVSFVFNNSTFTAATNGSGVAISTYTAPSSSGTYRIETYFAGDATYALGSTSATVTVARRASQIAVDSATVTGMEVFTATASLKDVLDPAGKQLQNRTVRFVFQNSTCTAITDGFGVARATYTAPSSSGTYRIEIYFSGDTTYDPSSSTNTIKVMRRPSAMAVDPVTGTALEIFTATATLADVMDGGRYLSSRPVRFVFQGSTRTMTADALGVAVSTFTAPLSSGTYRIDAYFDGDAAYDICAVSATVTIQRRNSVLAVDNCVTYALDVFSSTAALRYAKDQSAVSGKAVRFVFQGSTFTATSQGSGIAVSTFTAPSSSGTYQINAYFDGDATYNPGMATATVTAQLRATSLALDSVSTRVGEIFTATMTLTDVRLPQGIGSRTVQFVFAGSTCTAVTDGFGVAYATYTAPVSSGALTLEAYFTGDATYGAASSTATVWAARWATTMAAADAGTLINDTFISSATLTDTAKQQPLAGITVTLGFNGNTQPAVTNELGIATASFSAAGISSGSYRLDAAFGGNTTYLASSATGTVTVSRRASALAGQDGTAAALDLFIATATLRDVAAGMGPVSGRPVTFMLGTDTQVGYTDAVGVATVTFTAPAAAGPYGISLTFAGDAVYLSSSAAAVLTVIKRPTYLAGRDIPGALVNQVFTATATLTDAASGQPVPQKNLSFLFAGSTVNAVTDEFGVAQATYTAPSSSGTYQLDAQFAGDSTYLAFASSFTLTVMRRETSFTMPDRTTTALEVFTASATLRENEGLQPVTNRPVCFVFAGSTSTVLTNPFGVALATYTAPVSSGTYSLEVYFDGDDTYIPSASSATLTVLTRPVHLAAADNTAVALGLVVSTATLVDSLNGQPVADRWLDFVFNGGTTPVKTNVSGQAVAAYAAPVSSGAYRTDLSFSGDATYSACSASMTTTVLRRPTTAVFDDVVTLAQSVFTATATLRDVMTGQVIGSRPVTFVFQGSNFPAETDQFLGVACATYTAPSSHGAYAITVGFAGDGTYYPVSSTATVTATKRPSALAADEVATIALEVFTATATLRDGVTCAGVQGKPVRFVFSGSSRTVLTDALGRATTTFAAPALLGTYRLDAEFDSDSTYLAASGSSTVTVFRRPTALTARNTTATCMDVFMATATLRDSISSLPVPGKTVSFVFRGSTVNVTTDMNGEAFAPLTAPVSSGPYVYTASFSGDGTYDLCNSTALVQVLPRPTRVAANDTTANGGEPFTLQVVLSDVETGGALADKPVTFEFQGERKTAYTNAVGVASTTYVGPENPGLYYYSAAFDGDYTYAASSATAKIKCGILTTLIATDVEPYALSDFTARAKLVDAYSIGLENKPVRFVFGASSGTAATNVSGSAEQTFTAPASSGTYQYFAYYDGDSIYSASNATATVAVKLRPTAVFAYNTTTLANSSFTVSVELKDGLSGAGVGGRAVEFAFNGASSTVVTDGGGRAESAFFAFVSSGSYLFTACFDGDSTYMASNSTGTVTVQLRPTTLISYNIPDAVVGASCTARIELKDQTTNTGVANKTIRFEFQNSTMTVMTDVSGIAEQTFLAPSSTGTCQFTASFEGDDRYGASSSSATVTVGLRPAVILASNISVKSDNPFTAEGRLIDLSSLQGITGRSIDIVFQGTTVTVATNGNGISTASFTAPSSTGVFAYTVTFAGDTVYGAANATATVTVGQEPALLFADGGITVAFDDAFAVKATLSNSTGVRLPGRQILFTFQGSTVSGTTNDIGTATATFATAGLVASTGTYYYAAEFRGDTVYTACSATMNAVNVAMRATRLSARDVQTLPLRTFDAEAALFDNVTASPRFGTGVSSKTIVFDFWDGVSSFTKTGITDAFGVAVTSFTAPASTGTYTLTSRFAGDGVYTVSSATATVYVLIDAGNGMIGTVIDAAPAATLINEVFTTSATLSSTGIPVPGKTIEFSFFDGASTHTTTGITDAVGVATATFTAPASSGVYTCTAAFIGDALFAGSSDNADVAVLKYPNTLAAADVSTYYGEDFTARALLCDARTAVALSSRTLTFQFYNGVSTTTRYAITDASGAASVAFTAPYAQGTYSYRVIFPGDAFYRDNAAEAAVAIASRGTSTFLVCDDVLIGMGEVFTATATLTSLGRPVKDRRITFSFAGGAAVSTTSAYGVARSTFTAPASSGTYWCSAVFAGDGEYAAAIATATVIVVQREELQDPAPLAIVFTKDNGITLTWPEVTRDRERIRGYAIERSHSFRGGWERVLFVYSTSGVLSYSCPVVKGEPTCFRVKTAAWDKQESKGLTVVEVPEDNAGTPEETNQVILSEDNNAWVKIPEKILTQVYAGSASSAPVAITVKKEEHQEFLLAYRFEAKDGSGNPVTEFSVPGTRRGIRVSIAYDQVAARSPSLAAAANKKMAMYWFNGVEWAKLGGVNDILNRECYVYSHTLGQFSIKLAQPAESFTVNKVAPRIFTPEEDSPVVNRVRFYYDNPDNNEVTIRIFDVSGALVRRNLEREGDNVMFWDGCDQDGKTVKGGVYLYQVEAGRKVITGTVVVAK